MGLIALYFNGLMVRKISIEPYLKIMFLVIFISRPVRYSQFRCILLAAEGDFRLKSRYC